MTGGRLSRERLADLAAAVDDFLATLDGVETVGRPKRATELARLRELIGRYPDEAREMLADRAQ